MVIISVSIGTYAPGLIPSSPAVNLEDPMWPVLKLHKAWPSKSPMKIEICRAFVITYQFWGLALEADDETSAFPLLAAA